MSWETGLRAEALEQYRGYLQTLGRLQLGGALPGKVDLSGVIQQTLLEASQATGAPPLRDEVDRLRWLRRVFANNLTDEIRKVGAEMRDVGRERSLEAQLEESSARIEQWLAAQQSSPSERASRNEQLLRLAAALPCLPEDQRRAVEFHHLQGRSLTEIGAELGRSKEAVAGLLYRGLRRLRELLAEKDD